MRPARLLQCLEMEADEDSWNRRREEQRMETNRLKTAPGTEGPPNPAAAEPTPETTLPRFVRS